MHPTRTAQADTDRVEIHPKTARRALRLIPNIVFFLFFAGIAQSFAQSRTKVVDPFDRARALLEAAFPELVGSDEPFTVAVRSSFSQDWRLPNELFIQAVNRRRIVREDGLVVSSENPLLWSRFMFSRQQLDSAQFSGDRVHTQELEVLAAELGTNPDSSESDLVAALRKRGAHYLPTEQAAFVREVKVEPYMKALGLTTIRRTTTTFSWRLGNRELGAQDIVPPGWVVKVEAHDPFDGRVCISLLFEPIDGSLRFVGRTPNCQE
jgi:hypothetical protein